MLRFFTTLLLLALLTGCGDEGILNQTLQLSDENAPAAPTWHPDAITIDELIFPYAAKQAVGQHDILGEEFLLASCEVLYRSRRVRRSERDNRWVRLSTGQHPGHATRWTHDRVPQFLYIFLNFETEADFQKFQIGIYENVPVVVRSTHKRKANTWQLTLDYQPTRQATTATPSSTDTSVPARTRQQTQVATDTEWLSLDRLVSLAAAENLNGVRKVLTTGVEVVATHSDYVEVHALQDGQATAGNRRIYITTQTLHTGVHYYYVHVEVDSVSATELWLTHIP